MGISALAVSAWYQVSSIWFDSKLVGKSEVVGEGERERLGAGMVGEVERERLEATKLGALSRSEWGSMMEATRLVREGDALRDVGETEREGGAV